MLFKPRIGITIVEGLEEPLHQSVTPRIDLRQVTDGSKGVGTVASSSTRHLHLRQHLLGLLEDGDIHLGTLFLQVDGEEEARSTAADDRSLHRKTALESDCIANSR